MEEVTVKIMTVGSQAVGKSSLLETYTTDRFPSSVSQTIFESYLANSVIDGKIAKANLWDTTGAEEYDTMRPICYLQTDVFIFVFNVASRDSLEELKYKWIHEVRNVCPDVPIILVGAKSDLREDKEICSRLRDAGRTFVTKEEAEIFADRIGASCYVECSAARNKNVRLVFESAIRAVIKTKTAKSKDSKKSSKLQGVRHHVRSFLGRLTD